MTKTDQKVVVAIAALVLIVTFWVAVIWVAVHFIIKFW